ncbi:hypothetical protein ACIRD6_29540 [Streptomyces sp. NPDC102473]|uniref:hypothetical protein n=1 Tax=Streptomyces sp. NPDC102473 TaxID=3366180 RepID=UPI0038184724
MSARAATGQLSQPVTEEMCRAEQEHLVNTSPVNVETYSPGDIEALRTSVTDLLAVCAEVVRTRTDDGAWQSAPSEVSAQRDDAFLLIADLSRALSRARRRLRAIDDRARRRHDA